MAARDEEKQAQARDLRSCVITLCINLPLNKKHRGALKFNSTLAINYFLPTSSLDF